MLRLGSFDHECKVLPASHLFGPRQSQERNETHSHAVGGLLDDRPSSI